MTIRERLFGSIALLAGCLLLVGLFGAVSFERMTSKAETIVADRVMPLDQLKIISDRYAVDIVDITHKTRARSIGWAEAQRRVKDAKHDIDQQWTAYLHTQMQPEELRLARMAKAKMGAANTATGQLERILAGRDHAALVRFAERDMYPSIDPLTATIGQLIDLQVRVATDELAQAKSLQRSFVRLMLVIMGISVGIVAFAVHVISRRVITPIRTMTAAMERLSRDDLDFDLPDARQNDEAGTMARALEVFRQTALEKRLFDEQRQSLLDREHLARLEQERLAARERENQERLDRALAIEQLIAAFQADVSTVLENVDGAAREFHSTARSLVETAHRSTEQAEEVTAGAAVAANNVQVMAAATHQLSMSIDEIGRSISVSEEAAGRASIHAAEADRITHELADDAGRIGSIIELIKSIAGQTDLLALNATIEAARAGPAGSGFAVVANEIKALAARSSEASDEIEQLVRSIQTTSTDAAAGMNAIRAVIEHSRQSSLHIAASIGQQAAATDEISMSSTRAAEASEQVSGAIADVSHAAGNTARAAAQMVNSAQTLSKQSTDLRAFVEGFVGKLRAA